MLISYLIFYYISFSLSRFNWTYYFLPHTPHTLPNTTDSYFTRKHYIIISCCMLACCSVYVFIVCLLCACVWVSRWIAYVLVCMYVRLVYISFSRSCLSFRCCSGGRRRRRSGTITIVLTVKECRCVAGSCRCRNWGYWRRRRIRNTKQFNVKMITDLQTNL